MKVLDHRDLPFPSSAFGLQEEGGSHIWLFDTATKPDKIAPARFQNVGDNADRGAHLV
jgi:hypothetical protein